MVERIQNLDDLKVAIQSIIVKDYGDFKRKLVLYISRYQDTKAVSAEDKKRFALMIDRIQFHPIMDIESTRSWTLDQLNQLH